MWEVDGLIDKLKITDRLIYVDSVNQYNLSLDNISLLKFEDWKERHSIDKNKYYGFRSPSANSFSRVTSFNSKKIQDMYLGVSEVGINYRKIQYPNILEIDPVLLNNLSINLIVSKMNLKKKFPDSLKNFEVKHDNKAYLFVSKDSLPYFYLTKKLIKENTTNFLNNKINKNYAYIEDEQFNLINKNYSAEAKIKLTKKENGELNFLYESNDNNFLIISDLYDKNWKLLVDGKKTSIYRVNFFFKGIELPAGNYEVKLYYDNSKFLLSVFISIITLVILLFYTLNRRNLNEKNY